MKCTACLRDLEPEDFNKDRSTHNGYRSRCRECTRNRKPIQAERRRRLKGTELGDFLQELEDARAAVFKIEGPTCVAIGLGVAIYRLKNRLGLLRSESRCSRKESLRG